MVESAEEFIHIKYIGTNDMFMYRKECQVQEMLTGIADAGQDDGRVKPRHFAVMDIHDPSIDQSKLNYVATSSDNKSKVGCVA